jgi:hypothetical protein
VAHAPRCASRSRAPRWASTGSRRHDDALGSARR